MRIAILQLSARHGRFREALARARALANAAPTDLVLLPEASLSGYVGVEPDGKTLDFDLTRFAEPASGPTCEALAALARETDAFVAGPWIEAGPAPRDPGRVYNAFVVFDRAGRRVAHYRKRHPWYPETWATAGEEAHPLFEIEGVRTTLAICFDLHFVADEAQSALERADLLLFPSAWVEERDSRAATLGALARAHSVAIANANWAAGDVGVPGQGRSLFVDAHGVVRAQAGYEEARVDVELGPRASVKARGEP